MFERLIIHGGRVVTPGGVIDGADVLIDGERIAAITAPGAVDWPDAERVSAEGLLVLPGVVDPHTHIQLDTGIYQTSDDWAIGTQTAAFGGVTTVVDFATQFPGMTLPAALEARLAECAPAIIDYAHHMMVTDLPTDPAEARRALAELLELGVPSIKLYTTYRPNYYADDAVILHTLRAMPEGMIALVHCENDAIVSDATARLVAAGDTAWAFHGAGRPPEAEVEAIRRVLYLAKAANKPVYLVHNSTAASIQEVARARATGDFPPVFCETCPQYFVLDDGRYAGANAEHFILQPPLRAPEWQVDLAAAWPVINVISTDHCDYTLAQKQEFEDFSKTPGGLPGLETSFQLAYTHAMQYVAGREVGGRVLAADDVLVDLVRLMATEPARLFGLYPCKGALQPGSDADVLLYDPASTVTIQTEKTHTIGGYNPYNGMTVQGRVVSVLSRGMFLVREGAWQDPPAGRGQFLHGKPLTG